jgi:hypothetical protein
MKTWAGLCVSVAFLISCETTPSPQLGDQDRSGIAAALRGEHLPPPKTLEVTDAGWLVATFELAPEELTGSAQVFAERALLTIRNTMYRHKPMHAYRVTLNGPSPGPDLIRRYGSARFIEGGSGLEWDGK